MLKRLSLSAFALIATLPSVPARADEPKANQSSVQPLMQMKLDRAKNILEGLTMENFDKIQTNAQALKLLSMESGWNVYQTQQYMSQSQDFRRTADQIVEAAKDKDVGRAALGYVALTVRCVECHNYIRKNHVGLLKVDDKPE